MSCAAHCSASAAHFDRQHAEADRERYRRHGPDRTTRMILDALSADQKARRTLLDVGGGIGVIGLELLQCGIHHVVLVEAAADGLNVARELYAKRGGAARLETRHGDFVELEPPPHADLVTLDRVVCCYPDYERLLRRAAESTGEAFIWSYPRDRWFVRLMFRIENLTRRAREKGFRTFVHPVPAMTAVLTGAGLRRVSRRQTPVWCVEVWIRN